MNTGCGPILPFGKRLPKSQYRRATDDDGEGVARLARARAPRHACPVERAPSIVGATWTLLVLYNLMDGPKRFGELDRLTQAASPKALAQRLRDERLGLVTRTAYAEVPPRRARTHGAGPQPPTDHGFARAAGAEAEAGNARNGAVNSDQKTALTADKRPGR